MRAAFRTAITDTPTSANTAAHIVANPAAPKIRTPNFTARDSIIFWRTIVSVFFDIFMAVAILDGS